ncbi:phosphonate C-P lyase system protein PhnG [Rhizobium sp. YIM 134829]|uniref:phosphonate C-P lyase system protein PhnG n=1 Tax=Rhizobium sp. YIM 134829 TaxID=3390453 RepID=UPI00397E05E0
MTTPLNPRKRTLDILTAMPLQALTAAYSAHFSDAPAARAIRGPEVGLVMVRGRIGGGGSAFNLGEASVTRATVSLATGEIGHAMVLGRSPDKAALVAHFDALAQRSEWAERVERDVVAPAIEAEAERRRRDAEETEATRVDFFTLVRGEDA